MIKLGNDVKFERPQDGEFITMLTDTIVELLDFLTKKSEERFSFLMNQIQELDVDI